MSKNYDEVIELTKKLVSIESTNVGKFEKEIGDYVFNWIKEETGIEPVRDYFAEDRFNVVATVPGEIDNPALVIMCHMDVVPAGNGWIHKPFDPEIEGDIMYGRGVADMKSGLAAGMIAFRNFVKEGHALKHTLRFIATADEEGDVMLGAVQAIKSGYANKDSWVLDLEPTNGDINVGHKGKTWFKITTKGVAAHGSTPWEGVDAIAAMAVVVEGIRRRIEECPSEDPEFGESSVCFGTIKGGFNTNIVADEVTLTIDMRLAPPLTTEGSIKIVEDAIKEATERIKGAKGSYEIIGKKPYVLIDESSILLQRLQEAIKEETGELRKPKVLTGYTDSGVVAALTGNINCMSYGADGGGYHQPEEWLSCASLDRVVKITEKVMKKLLL